MQPYSLREQAAWVVKNKTLDCRGLPKTLQNFITSLKSKNWFVADYLYLIHECNLGFTEIDVKIVVAQYVLELTRFNAMHLLKVFCRRADARQMAVVRATVNFINNRFYPRLLQFVKLETLVLENAVGAQFEPVAFVEANNTLRCLVDRRLIAQLLDHELVCESQAVMERAIMFLLMFERAYMLHLNIVRLYTQ
ncbi:occlusion derived envelope/capsid protein [Dasychira pudibunda nucleopolyhedrovirus]|nr:occlusion derived envelope/capsid protein [Dasychira pudibunda nucleopolyhedrovirus]